MANNTETIHSDKRGRMRLKVIRKNGQYGPQYSAIVFRTYKKGQGESGKAEFGDTHWMDEQDVLQSKKLHDIADDVIAAAKRADTDRHAKEAA